MVTEAETPWRVPRVAVSRWNLHVPARRMPAVFTGTGALYDTPALISGPLPSQLKRGRCRAGEPTERRLGGSGAGLGSAI